MYDFITNLLNIDHSQIRFLSVSVRQDITYYHISLVSTQQECPFCGGRVHIHARGREKQINHPVLTQRKSVIVYRPLRYKCNDCSKTFSESNPFSFSSFRNSFFALSQIMKDLANLHLTYSDIAKKNHVSVTTVQKYMDSFVSFSRIQLPENIGIDEICSGMAHYGSSKYLCIMVDNQERTLFEILPSRSKLELQRYFDKIPLEERKRVRYWTMDMWKPYKDIALRYLPNCEVAVDPFHVVSHLIEALSRVRINILHQMEYGSDAYYLLKKWKDLLEKRVDLDNQPVYNHRFRQYMSKRDLLERILNISENLTMAYRLKEMYLDFNEKATPQNCEAWFNRLYDSFLESGIAEYTEFIITLSNWKREILNSFHRPYEQRKQSNALSENINNRLRKSLCVSNGLYNFIRFRKRSIYALNHKIQYSITSKLRSDKYKKM